MENSKQVILVITSRVKAIAKAAAVSAGADSIDAVSRHLEALVATGAAAATADSRKQIKARDIGRTTTNQGDSLVVASKLKAIAKQQGLSATTDLLAAMTDLVRDAYQKAGEAVKADGRKVIKEADIASALAPQPAA